MALAAVPLIAIGMPCAAVAAGMKRLGILAHGRREETLAYHDSTMRKIFADLGWIQGKTLEIVWRFGEGDQLRFPALARELVAARPDVILTGGTARTRALQEATRTIPIHTFVGDPVGSGFAQSLARPGGNITGLSIGIREVAQKQIELLRSTLPRLSKLAIVGEITAPTFRENTEPIVSAASAAGLTPQLAQVSSIAEMETVLRGLPASGRGAAFLMGNLERVDEVAAVQLAIRLRVPAITGDDDLVEKGALFSYSLYHEDPARRATAIIDKLLRGADPAMIPFELPNKSRFVINRRTATAIGVKFPADFLLRADKVIG